MHTKKWNGVIMENLYDLLIKITVAKTNINTFLSSQPRNEFAFGLKFNYLTKRSFSKQKWLLEECNVITSTGIFEASIKETNRGKLDVQRWLKRLTTDGNVCAQITSVTPSRADSNLEITISESKKQGSYVEKGRCATAWILCFVLNE